MLQAIHDNLKGVFAMIVLGALAVVFVFWGVEFVSVGGFSSTQGIEVNGEDVDANQVRQDYQEQVNQLQAALAGQDMPEALREQLRKDVLDRAVRGELIRQRTDELRFRASDRDVLEALQQVPAFQVDGKFSKDAYYAALRSANIEPAYFEAQQKQIVTARLLDRGIFASAFVLPGEFERREALVGESRELAWVVVPAAGFVTATDPDEAAITAWYGQHQDQFSTEELANLQYVELSLDELATSIDVSEEALHAWYEENRDRYAAIERRRARHILITSDGDDAAAEARARAAFDRAKAGEDFARLATELSQDPGSAAQGGDLGWQERSLFVGPFADAVWAMKAGEVTGPVKTEFGWHVIKLEGVEPGVTRSFEEVRPEIEAEYRRAESEKLFGDLQEQLDTKAFEAGGDLQKVAEALALEVKSLDGFTRAGGGPLGNAPGLVKSVFEPEVLNGSQLRTAEVAPGLVVAFKVVAHEPPRARPLEEVRPAAVAALKNELARKAAGERASALVQELRSGAPWSAVAKPWVAGAAAEQTSATLRFARRGEAALPVPVAQAAFKSSVPAGVPAYGTATLDSGDAVVWTVTQVRPGSPASLSPAERAEALRTARDQASFRDATVYVTQLRSTADVKVNPQLFE
jgi:peptidyl-prolyl cis-trans isomerase D